MKSKLMVSVLVVLAVAFSAGCIKQKPVLLESSTGGQERTPIYEHAGWTIARSSLHNHTVFSDGCREAEDLLELAQRQGMAILAYTDHREGKICLGKKICVDVGGVESVGYDVYYEELIKIQEMAEQKGMIVTKGVEVSPPWFRNYGKFPHLVIDGLYNHFTVYSIQDPQILQDMPMRRHVPLKKETDYSDKPYQDFVTYIHENGGIVHAVHVEDEQDEWYGPVHVVTTGQVNNIHLKDLQSFSILPEGWTIAGAPGGLWDTALLEYLGGMRKMPLFANADADYHGPKGSLAIATTLFYMKEFTEDEIYRCMREGRMVALQGLSFQDSYVSEWSVSDSGKPSELVMLGQEVKIKGAPTIKFALDHPVPDCSTRLVRNGVVVKEVSGTELSYTDKELGLRREPAYYRVEVTGPVDEGSAYESVTMPENKLFVNPVFVRFIK